MISDSPSDHKAWLLKPRLRPVDAFTVSVEGEEAVCLRDPLRIAPNPMFLTLAAVAVLKLLDGNHDLKTIQEELAERYGQPVNQEVLQGLIKALDENCFLEGTTFETWLAEQKQTFAAIEVRPPILAGQSYPMEPEGVSQELAGYFTHPKGPGAEPAKDSSTRITGLIAPHIDFPRGGPCYAWAYREIEKETEPLLVVLLGTAHCPTENPLTLCAKDFQTPGGIIPCARDLVGQVTRDLDWYIPEDEFIHRGEHSLEFQAVWLSARLPHPDRIQLLPVLCGSFHQMMDRGRTPEEDRCYEEILSNLKRVMGRAAARGMKVLVLASADLSHVGPQFGHQDKVTDSVQEDIRTFDLAFLKDVAELDHRSFFDRLAQEKDRTNVCGFSSIYTLLRLMDGARGRMLAYDQWVEPSGLGLVSFASLAFDSADPAGKGAPGPGEAR